jgi:predicted transcriptional regulator
MTFQFSSEAKAKKFIKDHPDIAKKYGITSETIKRYLKKQKKKASK